MTKTIREQLQALVDELRLRLLDAELSDRRCVFEIPDLLRLKAILATPEPAVTVKPGWVCKDYGGVHWHQERPEFDGVGNWYGQPDCKCVEAVDFMFDPWPDKPNGGPECVMEVR